MSTHTNTHTHTCITVIISIVITSGLRLPFVVCGVEITIYKRPLVSTRVGVRRFFDQFGAAAIPGYSVDAKAIRKDEILF